MGRWLKKHQILLIADEVITGFGRTGQMFGQQTYGFQADLTALAKGITSGYIPLGAVGVTPEIFAVLAAPDRMFMHGFTYSGHPVACAVALANLDIIEQENLPAKAAQRGSQLLEGLQHRLGDHPRVGSIRGKGLMAIVEVVEDRESKRSFGASQGIGGRLQAATRERGAIFRCSDNGIVMAPPLVITSDGVDELVDIIAGAVHDVLGG